LKVKNLEEFQIINFAKRLKELAKTEHGGVIGLAAKLNMRQPALSNYTSGSREPRAQFLYKLATLGVDLHWLLTGEKSNQKTMVLKDGSHQYSTGNISGEDMTIAGSKITGKNKFIETHSDNTDAVIKEMRAIIADQREVITMLKDALKTIKK